MFFFITSYDKRMSLSRDEFINDGNVNGDKGMVRREPLIRMDMMTVEFR